MEWHIIENWPAYVGAAFFLYWLMVLVVLIIIMGALPAKIVAIADAAVKGIM